MTLGSVAGEPIVLVMPASPVLDDDGDARGDRRVVGLPDDVERACRGSRPSRRTR